MNTVKALKVIATLDATASGKVRGDCVWPRWLIFVILLSLVGTTAGAQSFVTDDRGVTTHWSTTPQRVITLLPSFTETVCALDQCARLVGVDRYSNWPPQVATLPTLGGGMDPNIEAIVALKPDVVFAARSSRVAERLESLGLKVVVLEATNHADVQRVLDKVSQTFGIDPQKPTKLWQSINDHVSAAAHQLPKSAQQLRVYIEINRAPFGAGPRSFIGETLNLLGAQNILHGQPDAFPRINPEFVIRAQPDLIMISEHDMAALLERPGWSSMTAIKNNRICAFASVEQDILIRPGPRLAEAARMMADCLKRFAS